MDDKNLEGSLFSSVQIWTPVLFTPEAFLMGNHAIDVLVLCRIPRVEGAYTGIS